MTRLPLLKPETLNADQKQVYDAIAGDERRRASRRFAMTNDDGTLTGPFNTLLHAPGVGDAVQRLGGALRFESSLPGHLRELAILMVGARWRANYEWYAHAPIAEREGLDGDIIAAVKNGEIPEDAPDDVLTVSQFINELVHTRRVSDSTYARAHQLVGEGGLVELIAVIGYYTLISGLLNTFEIGVPEGEELPFGE